MTTTPPGGDDRLRSYTVGAAIARDELRTTDTIAADALDRVNASDIVVVRDVYDHVARARHQSRTRRSLRRGAGRRSVPPRRRRGAA